MTSDSTLVSSPRLVGGVEVGGDALEEARKSGCFSVCTVILEWTETVDDGDVSRSAILARWEVGVVEAR